MEKNDIQSRVRRYLSAKGKRGDEDLEQEMVLKILEWEAKEPDKELNMHFVYLNARDRLHPRTNSDDGEGKVYRDAMDHYPVRAACVEGEFVDPIEKVVSIESYRDKKEAREYKPKMSRAKYLSRFRFGDLPFCI